MTKVLKHFNKKKRLASKRNKKNNKDKFKAIDNLFYRIFFSALILLILSIMPYLGLKEKVDHFVNKNINFLKITSSINHLFKFNIFDEPQVPVYNDSFYENVVYKDGINTVYNESYSAVESLTSGVIIRIKYDDNGYNVTIQTINNMFITYQGLESIDVNMYKYIQEKEVIGKAKYEEGKYTFDVIIKDENNKVYSYYETSEN